MARKLQNSKIIMIIIVYMQFLYRTSVCLYLPTACLYETRVN